MIMFSEAQVGIKDEMAHLNIMICDKDEQAIVSGFLNSSKSFIATIRPNLPSKPMVILMPKNKIKTDILKKLFYGAVQASITKAISDLVEEEMIPKEDIDSKIIICKAFLSENAKDQRKVYHFNYGATKLAINRAYNNYPSIEKVLYEKDRAINPIIGYRIPRLWNFPYLQIALDTDSMQNVENLIGKLPKSDRLILEVGTPLVKAQGISAISKLRELAPDSFIVADLKTMDVSQIEVDMAFNETADAVALAGVAPKDSVELGIAECKRLGIYSILDMINVKDPVSLLSDLSILPDIVLLHRGIDTETTSKSRWELIKEIKEFANLKNKKIILAVAGGITSENTIDAINKGADIIVVGRYITQAKDPKRAVREFTSVLGLDIDHTRVHTI